MRGHELSLTNVKPDRSAPPSLSARLDQFQNSKNYSTLVGAGNSGSIFYLDEVHLCGTPINNQKQSHQRAYP